MVSRRATGVVIELYGGRRLGSQWVIEFGNAVYGERPDEICRSDARRGEARRSVVWLGIPHSGDHGHGFVFLPPA